MKYMGLLTRLFGGRTPEEDWKAIGTLTVILFDYLFNKYTLKHGLSVGPKLAPLVGNALGGFEISGNNEESQKFVDANRSLIEAELKQLSGEPELCYIVSVSAYVQGDLTGYQDAFRADRAQGAKRLREMGILLPKDSLQMPSSSGAFLRQVRQFQRWAAATAPRQW